MTTPEFLDLLSETAHLDSDGEVVMGGCRLSALAASYGTPLFVVDETSLRHQAQRFHRGLQERWPKSRAVFASKAFPCTAMYELMAQEGLGVDVAGGGDVSRRDARGHHRSRWATVRPAAHRTLHRPLRQSLTTDGDRFGKSRMAWWMGVPPRSSPVTRRRRSWCSSSR